MTEPSPATRYFRSELRLAAGQAPFECDNTAYILPHEHLLLNLSPWWEGKVPFGSVVDDGGLCDENIAAAALSPLELVRENLILSDWVMLARELHDAKKFGLALVVDLTSEGMEPDRRHALEAAKAAGVDLVVGTGHYREPHFAPKVRKESAEDRALRWLGTWRSGFDDGTLPGIVGEIGTSATISPEEQKSLIAAGIVSSETDAAISIHVEPFAPTEHEIVNILERAGAKRSRIVLSHCDVELKGARLRRILELETYVEFDLFGWSRDCLVRDRPMPSDTDRIAALERMIEWGVADRILLSHDVCTRTQWIRFGGNGYRHIGQVVRDNLLQSFGADVVEQLLLVNPLRMLSGMQPSVTSTKQPAR